MKRLLYRDAAPPADIAGTVARIKAWTRAALDLPPEVTLSVTELACSAEGCPPRETVILVMPPGERARKYSVHRAVRDVTEADITACAASPFVML